VSTADEISPEVANENSSLRCASVAPIAAWWFGAGEICEVEIDDGLQGFGGGGFAQGFRQGIGPDSIFSLQSE